MNLIFNKKFIIFESFLIMIMAMALYMKVNKDCYNMTFGAALLILKFAYVYDNWNKIIKYRKFNWNYMLAVLSSMIAAFILVCLIFYQPDFYEPLDAHYLNILHNMKKYSLIVIYFALFCFTIKFDNEVEAQIRSSIKCSFFEECSSCYYKSCINCIKAEENKISVNERIKVELIKEDKLYSEKLESSFDRMVKLEIRQSDVENLKIALKSIYEDEHFDILDRKY